jgi:hypothetical protein
MKRKFFTTFALFLSLALTACGGGKSNGGDAKWESDKTNHWHIVDGEQADKAKHTLVEDAAKSVAATCKAEGKKVEVCSVCGYVKETTIKKLDHTFVADTSKTNKPATCKEEGVEYLVCSVCGETKENKIAKLEHTWDAGVATGTCGEAGKIVYTCTACGETKEETSGYIPHSWTKTGSVAAGDGGLAYDLVKCSKCNKDGIMIAVKNADGTNNMTVTGTPKTAPEGCVKLGAAGDSITATIKLNGAKTGKLYFRGSMDYWYTSSNQNEQKGIYDGKGTADKAAGIANFKMEVGDSVESLAEVALTADKDLLYKDFLPEEVGFTDVAGTNWSQIGDIEVGNVALKDGINVIRFSRVDSYNLAIHDFVVAFDA